MQQTAPSAPAPQPAKPKPPAAPPEFQEGGISTMDAAALTRILTDNGSPEFKKAKACQRIGELGAKEAVPALASLLGDEHLSGYARYGLEPISDPSADDALRAALVLFERLAPDTGRKLLNGSECSIGHYASYHVDCIRAILATLEGKTP